MKTIDWTNLKEELNCGDVIAQDDVITQFWKRNYVVTLGAIGSHDFLVNADNEQDALDAVADFCEDDGKGNVRYPGFIRTLAEYAAEEGEGWEKSLEDEVIAGNHGLVISNDYIMIMQVKIVNLPRTEE